MQARPPQAKKSAAGMPAARRKKAPQAHFSLSVSLSPLAAAGRSKKDFDISSLPLLLRKLSATMFWTLELASYLEDAPWPATKDELIDYSIRSGAPIEVVENLQELEDEGEIYEGIEDIWPDYPSQDDFFFNEDEY